MIGDREKIKSFVIGKEKVLFDNLKERESDVFDIEIIKRDMIFAGQEILDLKELTWDDIEVFLPDEVELLKDELNIIDIENAEIDWSNISKLESIYKTSDRAKIEQYISESLENVKERMIETIKAEFGKSCYFFKDDEDEIREVYLQDETSDRIKDKEYVYVEIGGRYERGENISDYLTNIIQKIVDNLRKEIEYNDIDKVEKILYEYSDFIPNDMEFETDDEEMEKVLRNEDIKVKEKEIEVEKNTFER